MKIYRACAGCHKDLEGKLSKKEIESLMVSHPMQVSHGICDPCYIKYYGLESFNKMKEKLHGNR